MLETVSDRLAMLAPFDSASYLGNSIAGIFDAAYQEFSGIAGSNPMFTTDATLVPGIAQGSTLIINGVSRTVSAVKPDGTGLVALIL